VVKTLAALALLLSPLAASAMPVAEGWQLPNSEVATIASADGHPYRVLVAWPDGPAPPEGWPVLYVLDGEDNFAITAVTARRFARAGARSGIAPGVIVGIDSGDLPQRVLDYTPPVTGYFIPAGAPASGLAVGGGDRFLDDLVKRVRPWVERRWRINAARQTLAGHSFGGLLILHAMFGGKTSFSRFAAISPSLWYGDALMEREAAAARPAHVSLLVAVGEDERGPDGRSGSAAEAMTARLATKGVRTRFLALPGQRHGTTMLASTAEIIALAFGAKAQ
jgi:predicted alpha/beta superfamily hydrolase